MPLRRIFQLTSMSMRTPIEAVCQSERTGSAVVGPVPDTISSGVVSSMWMTACSDTSNSGASPRAVKAGLEFRPIAETVEGTLAYYETLPPARRIKNRGPLTVEFEEEMLEKWHARDKDKGS